MKAADDGNSATAAAVGAAAKIALTPLRNALAEAQAEVAAVRADAMARVLIIKFRSHGNMST